MELNAGTIRIKLNPKGFITSLYDAAMRAEYLPNHQVTPLLSFTTIDGKHLNPNSMDYNKQNNDLTLFFEGNLTAHVHVEEKPTHIVLRLEKVTGVSPERVDWGPYPTTIGKIIGETIGVVRDDRSAIGIQSLNIQTNAGASELKDIGSSLFAFSTELEGGVRGSSIAIFGCEEPETHRTIEKIEIAEGLPHPMLDGVWAKLSPAATDSYFVTDFNEANIDESLALTQKLGLKYCYRENPFATWGHFVLNPSDFPDGDESLRRCCEKAAKFGIGLGIHTLTSFITSNDPYVTPKPDPRLAVLGSSTITAEINETSSEITVAERSPFVAVQSFSWNRKFTLIGEEIIEFAEVTDTEPVKLKGCKRGMFGTSAGKHQKGSVVGRLATHEYETFFPSIEGGMIEEMTERLIELFNYCGLSQMSFDGLEGLSLYGYPNDYPRNLFVKKCYDGWDHYVMNDASNLIHYLWHYNTRMNWGEPWGLTFREGMQEYRFANQDYFDRNLLPRMLGWYEFRIAGSNEATTLDEIEWMLSKAAAFDAGFAIIGSLELFNANAQGNECAAAIREWEKARPAKAFAKDQRERMKDPNLDWHLEPVGDNKWRLWPITFSRGHVYNKLEPALWQVENPYDAQPMQFVLRVLPGSTAVDPSFEINGNVVEFKVDINPGQYLVCDGSKAYLCEANWNVIKTIEPDQPIPEIAPGKNNILFMCSRAANTRVEFKFTGDAEWCESRVN